MSDNIQIIEKKEVLHSLSCSPHFIRIDKEEDYDTLNNHGLLLLPLIDNKYNNFVHIDLIL